MSNSKVDSRYLINQRLKLCLFFLLLLLTIHNRESLRFGSKVWAVKLLNFRGWELTAEELPLDIRKSGLESQNIRSSIVCLSWLWCQPQPTYADKNKASKLSHYCHWQQRKTNNQTYGWWFVRYKTLCFTMWQSILTVTMWTLTFPTQVSVPASKIQKKRILMAWL